MNTNDAKTLEEQINIVSDMLVENSEGFGVSCENDKNVVCSDDMSLLVTKNESGGNIRDVTVGVVDKAVSVGEKGGVFDKEVENVVSVGLDKSVDETGDGFSRVLCETVGNVGVFDNLQLLGTESVNVETCRGVGSDKGGILDKAVEVENAISVDLEKSGDGFSGVMCEGISLVVDLSNDQNVENVNKVGNIAMLETDEFAVGDLVWGKFNSHPWWPAQVMDPRDASDKAKKCRPEGKFYLVAYFGDGSFLWRSSNLLKPFCENFAELSKKNDSVLFLTAVTEALAEIERVAELKLTCNCISEEQKSELTREPMVNAGIKKGVLVTECNPNRLPVSDFLPMELLSKVKNLAVGDCEINLLELTGLRSSISAFYRAKDVRKLDCCYYEGLFIEGMGDMSSGGLRGGNNRPVLKRCGGQKDSKKRKRESKVVDKSDAQKKMKSVDKFLTAEGGSQDEQPKAFDENASSVLEQDNGGSRKRKQSRYLSHPYTDPIVGVKLALESEKSSKFALPGEKMSTIAMPKLLENSGNSGGEEKKMVESAKPKLSPEEIVAKARAAALDPERFFSSGSTLVVNDFLYMHRKNMVYGNVPWSSAKSLSTEGKKETTDEMVCIKEKLLKMTNMVENCPEENFTEVKVSLEAELTDLLKMLNANN